MTKEEFEDAILQVIVDYKNLTADSNEAYDRVVLAINSFVKSQHTGCYGVSQPCQLMAITLALASIQNVTTNAGKQA